MPLLQLLPAVLPIVLLAMMPTHPRSRFSFRVSTIVGKLICATPIYSLVLYSFPTTTILTSLGEGAAKAWVRTSNRGRGGGECGHPIVGPGKVIPLVVRVALDRMDLHFQPQGPWPIPYENRSFDPKSNLFLKK